jgi:hypothetical protein
VAVAEVDESKAQQVVEELGLKGVRAIAVQADVRKTEDCKR